MIIDAIAALAKTALDKVIPDANVREQVALQIAQQAYAELQLEIQDRASARQREMQVLDRTPSTLAFITVGGFLGITAFLILNLIWFQLSVAPEAMALIGSLSGYLSAKAELALAYYFGSSRGSTEKNLLLAERR